MVVLLGATFLPACSIRKAGAEGQLVLDPTDDTYADDYNLESNFGAQDIVKLSSYQPNFLWYHTDIWLKFDLSSVPAEAAIDSATLQLFAANVTDTYNHTWAYSCANSSWRESTLTFQYFQDYLLQDMNFTLMSDVPVSTANQWYNWSVNDAVSDAMSNDRGNVTLVLMVGNGEIHDSSSYAAFCSKESELGLVYAPKLAIHWSNNPSVGKHEISLLDVNSSKTMIRAGKPTLINVLVKNTGDYIESFHVTIYGSRLASGSSTPTQAQLYSLSPFLPARSIILGTKTVTDLEPQGTKTVTFLWQTQGYTVSNYMISSTLTPISEEQVQVINNGMHDNQPVGIQGDGCCIIVAGARNTWTDAINNGTNKVYKILREVGYGSDDIYLMHQQRLNPQDADGDGQNDVDNNSTRENLQWAVETWARYRVSPNNPLFMYLLDHGGNNLFSINPDQYVEAAQLATWINNLESVTNASVHVIYAACYSGTFINNLSKDGSVTVTSSLEYQSSFLDSDNMEVFSSFFWKQVKSGHSIMNSFNYASSQMDLQQQTPLLDDNGDGVGHWACLPNNGDGALAANTYIGRCEWPFPLISYTVAKQNFTWPPQSEVTLWTQVENKTNLVHVRACMLSPGWTPPAPNDTLVVPNFEYFEMADPNHDGNWTVSIPPVNFTNHASSPSNFTFFITAEEENGDTATPSIVNVEFTATGMPSNDTGSPFVNVERPLEESVVHDTIQINGTATDNVCLKKAELYADGNLIGSINLQPTSNSYFEFNLDTTTLENGAQNITVKATDTSDHSTNQTLIIYVNNFVHDIALTDLTPSETSVQEGTVSHVNVTAANHGSYAETFNLSLYANSTLIGTNSVTLQSGSFTTIPFAWNTLGFPNGNYTLNAHAWPVPNEEDATNNNLTLTEQPVVIIPEFPSMLILPAFMLATLVVLVVRKRKRPDFSRE
jgi:hypothetical protein